MLYSELFTMVVNKTYRTYSDVFGEDVLLKEFAMSKQDYNSGRAVGADQAAQGVPPHSDHAWPTTDFNRGVSDGHREAQERAADIAVNNAAHDIADKK
jgi:hypothetical protein